MWPQPGKPTWSVLVLPGLARRTRDTSVTCRIPRGPEKPVLTHGWTLAREGIPAWAARLDATRLGSNLRSSSSMNRNTDPNDLGAGMGAEHRRHGPHQTSRSE